MALAMIVATTGAPLGHKCLSARVPNGWTGLAVDGADRCVASMMRRGKWPGGEELDDGHAETDDETGHRVTRVVQTELQFCLRAAQFCLGGGG